MSRKAQRRLFGETERFVTVSEYTREHAKNSHVLLWKRRGVYGWAIALHTSGGAWDNDRSHLTLTIRKGTRVYSAGNEEQAGRGALIPLVGEVQRNPGVIAVFELVGVTDEQAAQIADELETLCHASYCWSEIVLLVFSQNAIMSGLGWVLSCLPGFHLAALWLRSSASRSDSENLANFCSMIGDKAITAVMGPHYIQKKPSSEITPNDFGRSLNTRYLFTLIPDEPKKPRRRAWRVVLGMLLCLLAASVATFRGRFDAMKLYGHQIRIHLNDGKNHVELLGTEAEGRAVIAEQETGDDLRHAIGAFRDLAKARQAAATPAPAAAPGTPAETDPAVPVPKRSTVPEAETAPAPSAAPSVPAPSAPVSVPVAETKPTATDPDAL